MYLLKPNGNSNGDGEGNGESNPGPTPDHLMVLCALQSFQPR
jgi:hypothetical protein